MTELQAVAVNKTFLLLHVCVFPLTAACFWGGFYENIFLAGCPQSHITTSSWSKNNTLLHQLHNTDYTIKYNIKNGRDWIFPLFLCLDRD